jgi:FlhB-like protein
MSGPDPKALAVALSYDKATGAAPRVTAKGKGAVAEAIRAKADANGVPVQENALLAQALSQVELDTQIPVELYKAVAEVIGFVLRRNGNR